MARIADINWLYVKYYGDNVILRNIVMHHSEMVAKKALEICKRKNLSLNPRDVYCAAMLHDIGVIKCYAPDIHANGHLPYLLHGLEGKIILDREGLEKFSNVCLTHTGAGITKKNIKDKNLPLPEIDMVPKTLLEKLICYADKFFSKSREIEKEKNLEEIMAQMKKYGEDSYIRFMKLHSMFS